MDFNTQVCTTLEQSERLLALGLKKETADCRWVGLVKDARGKDIPVRKQTWFVRAGESEYALTCGFSRTEFVPAWSLHRLVAMMDSPVEVSSTYFEIAGSYRVAESGNVYDAMVDEIEELIDNGLFSCEYLEEAK